MRQRAAAAGGFALCELRQALQGRKRRHEKTPRPWEGSSADAVLSTVWQSVLEGFFMFWGTLWALVLGFTLSGAVQAFVSRREMQKAMGDYRPATVVRTGLLGAASSSCSYAAAALAKSLFQRGADFTTAMVFMLASTNLVVELGIVLWLLAGWQFALAEYVGGAIMIALFVLVAPRVFPVSELEQARARLAERAGSSPFLPRGG